MEPQKKVMKGSWYQNLQFWFRNGKNCCAQNFFFWLMDLGHNQLHHPAVHAGGVSRALVTCDM